MRINIVFNLVSLFLTVILLLPISSSAQYNLQLESLTCHDKYSYFFSDYVWVYVNDKGCSGKRIMDTGDIIYLDDLPPVYVSCPDGSDLEISLLEGETFTTWIGNDYTSCEYVEPGHYVVHLTTDKSEYHLNFSITSAQQFPYKGAWAYLCRTAGLIGSDERYRVKIIHVGTYDCLVRFNEYGEFNDIYFEPGDEAYLSNRFLHEYNCKE